MIELDHQQTPERPDAGTPPTTVSYAVRVEERRGRRSGQVDAKRCPSCDGLVAIDVRRMAVTRTGVQLPCTGCGSPVAVRRSDLSRPAPDTPAEPTRRRWFGSRSAPKTTAMSARR